MTGGSEQEPGADEYGYMLAAVGKVANEFVREPTPHLCREGTGEYLDQAGKVARSITGELTWDWGRGFLVVDTPMTQGVCGYVGGLGLRTRDAAFNVDTGYCVAMVTSLDDDAPIVDSRHLLVTALGRSRNTGTVYGRPTADLGGERAGHSHAVSLPADHQVAVVELGTAPVVTEPVMGTLALTVGNAASATVHALDHVGRRTGEVRPRAEGDSLLLPLPGEHKCCFYEVVW
jgi:hypothetical protein